MSTYDIISKYYDLCIMRGLKCEGCNLGNDYYSKGYRCIRSGFFFHEECTYSDPKIDNPYHPQHSLVIKVFAPNEDVYGECKLCRGNLAYMYYYCSLCDFTVDLLCARKKVTTSIESPKTHEHPLFLVPEMIKFTCHLCGLLDDRFPYACKLCDLKFHKDCAESTPEINYSCHPEHTLKRLTYVPSYTNEKCCLCGNKLHNLFYYCSLCNFSIDVNCEKNPPPFTLSSSSAHKHSLILMPQRSFVCNACGEDDDPNPYVCPQCNFMIHKNCIYMPRVIKIYRHEHRIYYKDRLEARSWKCEVCHKKMNWIYGAYSCSECVDFSVHLRCATRFEIWDGNELEGIPEHALDSKSYQEIDKGVIKHFSHNDHNLYLKEESDVNNVCMQVCKVCIYPIYFSPFYSCMECDDFVLHEKCVNLPKQKTDSFYKGLITLYNEEDTFRCDVCQNWSQGFKYKTDDESVLLDVRCGSISEPFYHDSHPHHSLYINHFPKDKFCDACGSNATTPALSCEECEFTLDIKCSILPKIVKHSNDKGHFLSLCYGEKATEQYWCDICEEALDPQKLFYSCDLCGITFHIRCTLGDFTWLKSKNEDKDSLIYGMVNKFITRPVCDYCNSRCKFSTICKHYGMTICSKQCLQKVW